MFELSSEANQEEFPGGIWILKNWKILVPEGFHRSPFLFSHREILARPTFVSER
jgi:hypothetical protein